MHFSQHFPNFSAYLTILFSSKSTIKCLGLGQKPMFTRSGNLKHTYIFLLPYKILMHFSLFKVPWINEPSQWCWICLNRLMTKPTKWQVHPAKTQISLGIRPVWSESSLSAWRKLRSLATHWVHSKDSDQTGRMPRLVWGFAGRTVIVLVLSWGSSFYLCSTPEILKLDGEKRFLKLKNLFSQYFPEIIMRIPAWCKANYLFIIEPHHEKTFLCHMRTTKGQISLGIRAVWSAPFLFAA